MWSCITMERPRTEGEGGRGEGRGSGRGRRQGEEREDKGEKEERGERKEGEKYTKRGIRGDSNRLQMLRNPCSH